MIEDIAGVTGKLVKLALDTASLRQATYANNIANVNSTNYRPGKVTFEQHLKQLQPLLFSRTDEAAVMRQLQNIQPRVEYATDLSDPNGSTVQLEQEMVRLTQNAIHYQALLTGNGKLMSIVQMAIQERIR